MKDEELRYDIVHIFVTGKLPDTPPIEDGGYRLSGLSAEDLNRVDKIMQLIKADREAAVREARIDEQNTLIAAIKLNDSDKYPTIDDSNVLSYADHGYAAACRTIRLNAERRIKQLQSHPTNTKEEE